MVFISIKIYVSVLYGPHNFIEMGPPTLSKVCAAPCGLNASCPTTTIILKNRQYLWTALQHHYYLIYRPNLLPRMGVGISERTAKHMTEIYRHNAHSINTIIILYSSTVTTNLFHPWMDLNHFLS